MLSQVAMASAMAVEGEHPSPSVSVLQPYLIVLAKTGGENLTQRSKEM